VCNSKQLYRWKKCGFSHPNPWNLAGNNTSRDSVNYKNQAKKRTSPYFNKHIARHQMFIVKFVSLNVKCLLNFVGIFEVNNFLFPLSPQRRRKNELTE